MKKNLYTIGIITMGIVFLGAIFKVNHLPGAGIMLTIGMLMLIFLFLPLALTDHYRADGNRHNLILYLVTWLTCLVVFGSMLFKIQHWPGAGKLLMIALPFPYVVFLPVFLVVTSRIRNFSIHNTVYVLFLLSGISVFSVLLSLNVSKERIDDSINLSRNYNRVEVVLDIIPATADGSAVAQKIDNLIGIVSGYQSRILAAKGITGKEWNRDPLVFTGLEYIGVPSSALIAVDQGPKPDLTLERGLKELISQLEATPGYEQLAQAAPVIFEYVDHPDAEPGQWTREMLMFSPAAWSMIYLDGLETNLKLLRADMQ